MPMTFHALTSNVCVSSSENLNRKLLTDYICLRTWTINNLEAFTSSLDTKQDWGAHILSSDVAYHCVTLLPSVVLHVHTGKNPRLTTNPRYMLPPSPLLLPPLPLSPLTTPSPERRREGLVKKGGLLPLPPSPLPNLPFTSPPHPPSSPLTTFPSLLLSLQPPPPPTVTTLGQEASVRVNY